MKHLSLLMIIFSNVVYADDVQFNRDVRPILSDKCFACHGPDEKTREAELRLDEQASAFADRDGSQVIVVGEPAASSLIARITSTDESDRMPPPEHGKALTADEIKILQDWIQQGAKYQEHWSYIPLSRPEVPVVAKTEVSPIDSFIRRKQLEANVSMNDPADRRTLLRRISFDLTGLPPTYKEVLAFEKDDSNDAYEKMVDRLLQSPHFGERMAIYWLDLVRYADTLGYHGDQVRSVSPYRDYVIDAFNSNKPFNEFTTEQLAGDLLSNASLTQKVASTYNRLNRASAEGGLQPKEYLAKYTADRVRTAGAVWLGSTIGCAECHDHKFDPFSAKDFYSFGAFFADIKEQGIVNGANYIEQLPVPTGDQQTQLAKIDEQLKQTESNFNRQSPELDAAYDEWETAAVLAGDRWKEHNATDLKSQHGTTLTSSETGVVVASGQNPDKEVLELEFATDLATIGALRIDVLADDSLPARGPGRAANGNFVVNEVEVSYGEQKIEWAKSYGSHAQNGFPPENLAQNATGWAILPKAGQDHYLILEAKQVLALSPGIESEKAAKFKVTIKQNHGSTHTLGRFKISASPESAVVEGSVIPSAEVAEILKIPTENRNDEQRSKLNSDFRNQTPLLKQERDQLAQLRTAKKQIEGAIVTTLVTVAAPPREMRVLPRGDWMSTAGDIVTPAVPEFLSSSEHEQAEPLNRVDLAKWLTSAENPLVARTFVNRLWMLYFGHGISRSVDDLGSQGDWPTHPGLLDWLAIEFIDSGWDVKHLIKLIVMSETYQQSSIVSPEMRSTDPFNKLFARQTKQRLDAEMIRDNALFVSGLLVDKVGGPSSKPYQPAGYWAQLNFPKRTYQHDQNDDQYRRGLYTHWQRTFLHPSLLAFDAPAREECTAKREKSNTPLQALVLLNDPTYVESARVFAAEIVQQAETFEERLNFAYGKCLSRVPTQAEMETLRTLYQSDYEKFSHEDSKDLSFLKTGLAPAEKVENQSEIAAWTSLTRVLLNLHETITRY
ncbi:PSD1 and planctomycete cytochrome C domain-containing protein [Planctomicrobium sp.]|nr:PSD1 and planctomycete cytochrome C domain-containing protein [Planctomicrobium sp.]MDB4733038.1 PSD1 and planctomycete cytochrome C domain-containing protein [Planctomicrobium sp.]